MAVLLKHIVFFKFRDGAEKADNVQKVKSMLQALPDKISEIKFFEVGQNFHPNESPDLVLYSEFEGQDALSRYQKHPEHVKVADFVHQVCENRIVADYLV